jgi:hypothetical protein
MVKYSRLDGVKGTLDREELKHEIEKKINKIEKFAQIEDIKEEKRQFEKAGRYLAEERKWINEVVMRVDIVPEEGNYYDKLSVKPGFDFFYALINCEKEMLDKLHILIPDTLYFN